MTSWLEMTPGHFDAALLPRKHRKPEPAGLFSVADVAPSQPTSAKPPAPQLEGQLDILALLEE